MAEKPNERQILLDILDHDWFPNQIGAIIASLQLEIIDGNENKKFNREDHPKPREFKELYKKGGACTHFLAQRMAEGRCDMQSIDEIQDGQAVELLGRIQDIGEKILMYLEGASGEKTNKEVREELSEIYQEYRNEIKEYAREADEAGSAAARERGEERY